VNFRTVLFDYDGVTADTPRLNFAAWHHVFKEAGKEILPEEYYLLEGHSAGKIAEILCARHGLNPNSSETLRKEKETYMRKLGEPYIYPDIWKLLAWLDDQGVAMGLVTGASRNRINETLPHRLRAFYGAIITSDEVTHTKPHPEPYIKGMTILGGTPLNTLVIENAPLGIASAKSAGIVCFAITTTLPRILLKDADIIVNSHNEIWQHLS
jgi:beta-phosphoglucomutase